MVKFRIADQLRKYETIKSSFFQSRLLSEDVGAHLMDVEDLLQKHDLLESEINIIGERIANTKKHSER